MEITSASGSPFTTFSSLPYMALNRDAVVHFRFGVLLKIYGIIREIFRKLRFFQAGCAILTKNFVSVSVKSNFVASFLVEWKSSHIADLKHKNLMIFVCIENPLNHETKNTEARSCVS